MQLLDNLYFFCRKLKLKEYFYGGYSITFKTSLSLREGGRVIDFKMFWNGGGREFLSYTTSETKK